MRNILILGSNGMLGYGVSEYFKRKGYGAKGITKKEFDVLTSNVSELQPVIKPADAVINCIGVIKPMIEKYSVLDVIKINGVFPRNLSRICKLSKTPLIHITTDCTFSGKKGNYDENDLFDAEDLYGVSKISGEITDAMTLKTSFIGPEKGTKRSLLEWALDQKEKTVNGFTNHRWNGVTTIYFAQIAEKIINEDLYAEGIFHLFSPDTVTKYELVCLFNEIFKLEMTINPVEAKEFCDRSLSSIYPLSQKVSLLTIKEQLTELKKFFNL